MAFCPKCGEQIGDGVKYCANCGAPTSEATSSSFSKRRQEYAGKVIMCPACGAEIPSLTAICPACGHEINTGAVSDSLKEFVARIDDCDMRIASSPDLPKRGWATWSKGRRFWWVIVNIFLYCIPLLIYTLKSLLMVNTAPKLTSVEKQKVSIIENYTFPNERGPILDAILFVKSKVATLAAGKINNNSTYWIHLWANMSKQLYERAEMLFSGDKIANDAYQDILSNEKKVKKVLITRFIISIGLIVIAVSLMFVLRSGFFAGSNTDYTVKYDWPNNQFTEIIVKPVSKYGKVQYEYEESFGIDIYKVSNEEFDHYVNQCRDCGFDEAITKTTTFFSANNNDGYSIMIYYDEKADVMTIYIDSHGIGEIDIPPGQSSSETNTINEKSNAEDSLSNYFINNDKNEFKEAAPEATKPVQGTYNAVSNAIIKDSESDLIITKAEYYISNGYLSYAICIHNNSTDNAIKFPKFRITARDASNGVLGTGEQVLNIIYPNEDYIWVGIALNVSDTPKTVEFELLKPKDHNIEKADMLNQSNYIPLEVQGERFQRDEWFPKFLGDIYNPNDYKVDQAVVCVINRDNVGNMVGSGITFISDLTANGRAPFELTLSGDTDFEHYEIYAHSWD